MPPKKPLIDAPKKVKIAGKVWTINKRLSSERFGGQVFLVSRSKEEGLRALKIISLNRLDHFPELEVSRKMRHPNLIKVYSTKTGDKYAYILMEYCPLGDLANWQAGKGSVSEALAKCVTR